MSGSGSEDLVQSVTLYNNRPVLLHGYVYPFVGIYALWGYIWSAWIPPENATEAGLIGLAAILVVQTLVYLFCHWSVHVCCYLTCTPESDPLNARLAKVIPTPSNGSPEIVRVHRMKGESGSWNIWFIFQECKYIWDFDSKTFQALEYPVNHLLKTFLNHKGYQDDNEVFRAAKTFGPNKTTMRIPSFQELFTERATAPFFVFQVFCVLLWCLDEYWMYSVFTLFMLVVFECTLVQQQLRSMSEIRNMGNKPYRVQVYRNRKWRPLPSDELLPGDIVSMGRSTSEELIPCDMLLLRGPCIVDESMLTGESVPQMKEPIESEFSMGSDTFGEDRRLELETDCKLRVLFGGTKIVQHTPPSKSATALRAPDNGCICYVLRTGFSTSQGKLLRTIMYGVKRVTANNLETFCFILFLLIFAIAAAAYVWIKGTEDPDRNRYKLFLECTLILTSVVPPELPIELSLAVNSSVLSLSKLGVYCTEPFRIPFAGKTEICCFDKTGTLTSDNLIIEGVAGSSKQETNGSAIGSDGDAAQSSPQGVDALKAETIQTIAACHSLVTLDDGTIVGDPLEKVALKWIDWDLNREVVVPKKGAAPSLRGVKIFHRYHFNSSLKRMAVVAGYADGLQTEYFAAVKGAPEVMKSMFAELPEDYEQLYLSYTRRGARVLALGMKTLGRLSHQDVRQLSRDEIECELKFQGFLIVSCPLKGDSKQVIQEIMHASHKVIVITGDNALTACHVAKQLKIAKPKNEVLIFNSESFVWESIDGSLKLDFHTTDDKTLLSKHDLCITGDGMTALMTYQQRDLVSHLNRLAPHISVYARMAPKQKEWVINAIKSRGFCTLMCGDGTNDVGALKHAHVGVAILSHDPEWVKRREKILAELQKNSVKPSASAPSSSAVEKPATSTVTNRKTPRSVVNKRGPAPNNPRTPMERQMAKLMKDLEEDEKAQIVKLGDASIAAPFSSKMSSIECICHVIKQGRCTLVTTLQMFKILALNALVLAYSQSVLYLDGIKLSDSQATFHGLLLAACFFFISHSKPLKQLSKKRPLPNIFNAYTLLTVLVQFAAHFCVMMYLVQKSVEFAPEDRPEKIDLEKKFEPNLLNSTVYIISLALQVITFFVNYRGHPFMESVMENRPFFYSIVAASCAVIALVTRIMPELNETFEVVPIPSELQRLMLLCFLGDLIVSYGMDRICMWFFGEGRLTIK